MKKLKIGLIAFAVVIIIAELAIIDYGKLPWSNNIGAYCGIFAMIGVIISMVLQIRADKKQQNSSRGQNS